MHGTPPSNPLPQGEGEKKNNPSHLAGGGWGRVKVARQDAILVLLSLAAGGIDALSFFALGAFTSAMSGNTILLGLALAQGKIKAASSSLFAFAGYIVGVTAATPLGVSAPHAEAARVLRRALVSEAVLLAAFAALWGAEVEVPVPGTLQRGLLVLAGIAMGLQAATARKLNAPGINTVVFTSTLTAIVGALCDAAWYQEARRIRAETWRQIAAFVFYLAGAAAIGLLALQDVTLAAMPPFACVLVAVLLAA
ncbi:MAG TPA: YoaK family protein [Acetobacteraceae bacterium]|nr:YoaK family protein [Acetobacteraceae bacterium]